MSINKELANKLDGKAPQEKIEILINEMKVNKEYQQNRYLHGLLNGLILAETICKKSSTPPKFAKVNNFYFDDVLGNMKIEKEN